MKRSFCRAPIGMLVAAASLAACSAHSTLPPAAYDAQAAARFVQSSDPDAQPPACKGQKTTKEYAQSKPQSANPAGGHACVPKFQGWGGSIKYPGFSGNGIKITTISSTTAYDPGAFPPSTDALFYLQVKFNGNLKFNAKLPAGASLANAKLKVKKPYTIEAAKDVGSLWQVLPYCYTDAVAGQYGPMIGGLGYPLEGGDFGAYNDAVIWIQPGKLVTQKC